MQAVPEAQRRKPHGLFRLLAGVRHLDPELHRSDRRQLGQSHQPDTVDSRERPLPEDQPGAAALDAEGVARSRAVAGVFYQRQQHGIEQRYVIQNLADSLWVTGWPDTWWLTEQVRVDRDRAAFAEGTVDITDQFSFTAGIRHFKYDNTLGGFSRVRARTIRSARLQASVKPNARLVCSMARHASELRQAHSRIREYSEVHSDLIASMKAG